MMEGIERTEKCKCNRCGKKFTIKSKIGPSNICKECARAALDKIFGRT
jgi:hypothetical protein